MADIEGKLRTIRVALFDEADAATLQTTVNVFLESISDPSAAGHDREFVSIQYQVSTTYSCMIVYTE